MVNALLSLVGLPVWLAMVTCYWVDRSHRLRPVGLCLPGQVVALAAQRGQLAEVDTTGSRPEDPPPPHWASKGHSGHWGRYRFQGGLCLASPAGLAGPC